MDKLYFFVTAVTALFALLVVICAVVRAIKYPDRTGNRAGSPIMGSIPLELAWSVVPFFTSIAILGWTTVVFFDLVRVAEGTLEMHSSGKQQSNVPHSLSTPAFRVTGSGMIRRVVAQEPDEYQNWFSGGEGRSISPPGQTAAAHTSTSAPPCTSR